MNIKRHPLNGRNFEYFSEDPDLAGEMAKAYIGGLQGGGVGACLKHFCCNNLEYDRLNQSSEVDERTLRELYYLPFEIACEAQPVSLMCSYNRINGTFGAEYAKGFALLRGEFGFRGAIVSDWSAVRDRTASAAAGLDLEMPFNGENYRKLCEDYRRGALSDAALDACAQRVLDLVYRCKEMRQGKKPARTDKERRAAARRIAAEGMVLLKNNGVLPLQAGGSAALSGCYARPDTCGMLRGGGSSAVNRGEEKFNLPARLAERGTEVRYEGAFRYDEVESFGQSARRAALLAAECDCSIVCVGLGEKFEREGADRETARLPAVQERAILESAKSNPNTVVVVFAGLMLLVYGSSSISRGIRSGSNADLVLGIVMAVVGLLLVIATGRMTAILLVVMALFIMALGVLAIVSNLDAGSRKRNTALVVGIALIIVGVVLLAYPGATTETMMVAVGVVMVVVSLLSLYSYMR